jgi:hypothetical protein
MAIPFPTVTNYTNRVNYASYLPTDISSLMKKTPVSSEKFFGSQEDDYIELSIFDSQDNLNKWVPIVQLPTYKDRQVQYQDSKNNTNTVTYREFVPSFTLYENSKILLDPKTDLQNLGLSGGSYRLVYNFQSNIVGSYDKQCFLIKQVSPSRREIKATLLLDKENFTNVDKANLQSEFDCFVSGKIESRDILPDFESYLKQTYILNFVNVIPDNVKQSFSKGYSVTGSDALYELFNGIFNGYQLVASSENGVSKNQTFIGISSHIMLMLYENYNNCFSYEEYSKILESIVSETINLRLKSIHDIQNTDSEVCNTYLFSVFNSQIQGYLNAVNYDYSTKYVGPLKNSINFGDNTFFKILSSKKFSDGSLVIKLQNQLPNTFGVNNTFWITNTSLAPVVQDVVLESLPTYNTFNIKNANFNLKVNDKRTSSTVNLNDTSDIDDSSSVDVVLKKRFSTINVDYTKFENFVVYSSAKTRITIYKNKLNSLNSKLAAKAQIDSVSYSDVYTVSKSNSLQSEINDILLSFDGYEYYLYTNDFYNNLEIFPKSYEDEAGEYDSNNRDSLINNLPEYILVDSANDEFLIFLSMIGHHFDNIYVYIDKFPLLTYNSGGLEKLIPNNILDGMLSSFGWNMQSLVNDTTLSANYINSTAVSSISDKANIINNRILNTLPAILKSKGTIESVKLILSCYGVPENILTVREFGSYSDVSQSLYTFDKTLHLLSMNQSSYITMPYTSSVNTVEFKIAFSNLYSKSYNLQAEINLLEKYSHTSSLDYRVYAYKQSLNNNGKIIFQIGDQYISSKMLPLFDGSVYSVMIRKNTPSSLYTSNIDENLVPTQYDLLVDITEEGQSRLHSKTSGLFGSDQNDLFADDVDSYLKFGSNQFSGSIDKINVWTIPLSDDNFVEHTNNFDSYYQDDYANIRNNLFFRLAYDYPRPLNTVDESFTYGSSGTAHLYNIQSVSTDSSITNNAVTDNPYLYQDTIEARKTYGGTYDTSSLYPYSSLCLGEVPSQFPYNFLEYTVNQAYRISNYGPNLLWNNKISVKEKSDVTSITPFQKSTPYNKNVDSNLVGVFASPVSSKNADILQFFGDKTIINELGDPRLEFSQSYSPLDLYRSTYYEAGDPPSTGRLLYQEFTTIYKVYFDSSIFESIRNVIAARNKLLTGILIEPTILERTKFPLKPINMELVETDVTYSDIVNTNDAENISIWRNDQYYNPDVVGTLDKFVDKPGIQANPYSDTIGLNNNFGGNYISDVSTDQELILCGENNGSGLYITYLDFKVTDPSQNYINNTRSLPYYIWSIPYSASVESYDVDDQVHHYYKTFQKIIATPISAYSTYASIGTPNPGCTKNYLGHRNNVFTSDSVKILSGDGTHYGVFKRNGQTSDYTVDHCGDPDKTSPIVSTIVTNTSIVTNNNGVLTVR